MPIGSIATEQDLRNFVKREIGNLPELVRQLQGAAVGWRPDWQAPTFAAGWSNGLGGSYPVGFAKDPSGLVRIRGVVQRSSRPPAYDTIFTLPAGYRPGQLALDAGWSGTVALGDGVPVGVQADLDGTVRIRTISWAWTNDLDWIALDGIPMFWAEG